MAYAQLNYEPIVDPELKHLFHRTDMYLYDVYGMFRGLPPADHDGGGGNFSITLMLLCVVDGLSKILWPDLEQEQRFKRLIREKIHWGPEGNGKWLDRGNAAQQLYIEFRNVLVHELGQDKACSDGYAEPIVGRWGMIPDDLRDIAKIDALVSWNDAWPVMRKGTDTNGRPCIRLAAAGLYWAVKRLAQSMTAEAQRHPRMS